MDHVSVVSDEEGQKWSEFLRWNLYLSDQHKLVYIATPKVACTSLKWWFASLEGFSHSIRQFKDSAETDPELVIHDAFHKVAPHVTGLSGTDLDEALTAEKYSRFALVRNPFKRIFSAWQSKILLREPLQTESYTSSAFLHLPVENKIEFAKAFEEFLEHLLANEAPSFWDVHWAPQTHLLQPHSIAYTKIFKIEEPEELSKWLVSALGKGVPSPFASKRRNESLIDYHPEFFTQRSVAIIQLLYNEDFENFGYDKELPSSSTSFSEENLQAVMRAVRMIRARHQRFAELRQVSAHRTALLNEEILRCRKVLEQRSGELAKKDAEHQNIVEAKTRTVERLVEEVADLKSNIGQKDELIAGLPKLDQLEAELALTRQECLEWQHQLHSVLTSSSWTVTRPARWLASRLTERPYNG